MIIDLEVLLEFIDKASEYDEASYYPGMTKEELDASIKATSGIDNPGPLNDLLYETVVAGIAAETTHPSTICRAIAHACFELGYKMGLYANTQKPN